MVHTWNCHLTITLVIVISSLSLTTTNATGIHHGWAIDDTVTILASGIIPSTDATGIHDRGAIDHAMTVQACGAGGFVIGMTAHAANIVSAIATTHP